VAVFGKKDYQQLMLIRRMVDQFALPIVIEAAEIFRAESGLALSSRNGYLSDAERAQATELIGALRWLSERWRESPQRLAEWETLASSALTAKGWACDYLTVRRRTDLHGPTTTDVPLVALGAARLGGTRLIDNLEF
jgi:pantoate--beta-alanine ligase